MQTHCKNVVSVTVVVKITKRLSRSIPTAYISEYDHDMLMRAILCTMKVHEYNGEREKLWGATEY